MTCTFNTSEPLSLGRYAVRCLTMPHPTYLPPLEIDAASLSAEEIAAYFRSHPEECKRLLHFSYDKRSSPNTFIEERGWFFSGWLV